MNKNLTSYLTCTLDKFLNDEINFRSYVMNHFTSNDFKSFEHYLKNTSNTNYCLYIEHLVKYNEGLSSDFFYTDDNSIDLSSDESSVQSLSEFIFSNKNLKKALKKHLESNPLSVLVHSEDFLKLLRNFISPHIQNKPGVIFVDDNNKVSLYLNIISNTNYITLNLFFIKICLKALLETFDGDYSEFNITVKNNTLIMSYGNSTYKSILINKEDMNNCYISFGHPNNEEKLLAVNIFYNKNISYEFFMFYFSKLHLYTSQKYYIYQNWVVAKYRDIMDIPYFKRIAEEYSVGISVLMHSICPFEDTFEYMSNLSQHKDESIKDSFAFSFALWLYDRRGYYSDNSKKQNVN